ncbi:MAG: AbgT family transporter, partial [Phascolarctobacterium sp.]|nr:AbgT family transporter [Phascolarctobacterium sp.]
MKNTQEKQQIGGILGLIERVGNKIPDITILFVGAFVLVCVISAILSQMHFDYVHPTTGKNIVVNNMLSGENIVLLLSKMVSNYAGFPPLGMVIVATLGIGIADGSGFINTGLKKLLAITPKFLLTPIIILAGMLSHIGPDTGYVIIIPVAAYMFYASGKHPLSGIAASFAGIAGAFAANYTPSAIDPVIQGFTQSAAQLIDPSYQVNVLCNYFYGFASTFAVIACCWYVTEKISEPWLWKAYPLDDDIDVAEDSNTEVTPKENRAFWIATGVFIVMSVALVMALLPADSILRDKDGIITSFKAPIMQSIISLLFIFTGGTGLVYGVLVGKFKSPKDVTNAMENITKTLVQLIVFYFFAAQFLWAFGAS